MIKYFAFEAAESMLIVRYLCVHYHNTLSPHNLAPGISVKLKPCPNASHFINLSDRKLVQWHVHYLMPTSVDFLCTWHWIPSVAHSIKPHSTASTPPAVYCKLRPKL